MVHKFNVQESFDITANALRCRNATHNAIITSIQQALFFSRIYTHTNNTQYGGIVFFCYAKSLKTTSRLCSLT